MFKLSCFDDLFEQLEKSINSKLWKESRSDFNRIVNTNPQSFDHLRQKLKNLKSNSELSKKKKNIINRLLIIKK
jgi:hypothetical protein